MICVSISHRSQIGPEIRHGIRLMELRFDLIGEEPAALYPLIPKGIRTIATCRPSTLSDEERARILSGAIRQGASYVDMELEMPDRISGAVMQHSAENSCEVIYSYHDFNSTPGRKELKEKLEMCYQRGGAVAKIATLVKGSGDLMNLLSLYDVPGRKVIVGMGRRGRILRVVAPYLGSEFTFASPVGGGETAPGQLDAGQLSSIYKVIDES